MKKFKYIFFLVPILIVLIVIVAFNLKSTQTSDDTRWNTKEVYVNNDNVELGSGVVPTWEYRSITGKYNSLEFLGNEYFSFSTQIGSDKIGENLGTAILSGYDDRNQIEHNINSTIYKIKDIPEKYIVAVQFENDNNYYEYINFYYQPETLGELIEDLNMKETIVFGSVLYEYSYIDSQNNYHKEDIEFPDVNDEIIWQMLFDDLNVRTENNNLKPHKCIMTISAKLSDYRNMSFDLAEDGYITTKLFVSNKTFYIGEDKVKKFLNYVLENYQGYKTVYVYENNEENKNENKVTNEEIVVVENKMEG